MKAGLKISGIFFLILLLGAASGCNHITVEVLQPADGAHVGSGVFDLKATIRSTGACMGGERCDHVDWKILVDGSEVCAGTGSTGGGSYPWCSPSSPAYCDYLWGSIPTSDIGAGGHTLTVAASASCHQDNSDSVSITVP